MKIKARTVPFVITMLSFLSIALFFVFFVNYAPGNYTWDANIDVHPTSVSDIIFAFLLIINDICIFVSFYVFFKVSYNLIRRKETISLKQFRDIILGLYPIIIIFLICSWNFSRFFEYLIAPVKLLFRF